MAEKSIQARAVICCFIVGRYNHKSRSRTKLAGTEYMAAGTWRQAETATQADQWYMVPGRPRSIAANERTVEKKRNLCRKPRQKPPVAGSPRPPEQ